MPSFIEINNIYESSLTTRLYRNFFLTVKLILLQSLDYIGVA